MQGLTLPMVIGVAFAGAITAPDAHAGGFMLQEQSQVEIGRAFSGAAASADDPSTVWYNPAGMTELPGLQMSVGVTALFAGSRQEDAGTTISRPISFPSGPLGPSISISPTPSVSPVSGTNGGNPFAPVVPVPTGYVSRQMGESGFWLGLGITAPFGLKLRYDDGFFGRYDSTYSNLLTINAQPSVAWRLSDSVSFGVGLDIQYADATLASAVPYPQSDLLTPMPAASDAAAKLSGDDVALGWNAGILVKLDGGIRLGLHYRSRIKHNLKGSDELRGFVSPFDGFNNSISISGSLSLPDIVTASISLALDKATRLMATGRYYNWSVLDKIVFYRRGASILPSPPALGTLQPVTQSDFNYRDSWSLSAGLERRLSDRLTVRAGSMFDRTPTNSAYLSTRVPDGNRTWLSGGVSYGLTGHLTLNASYAHVFIAGQTMARTQSFYGGSLLTSVTTRSRQSGNVDMIATSLTARF